MDSILDITRQEANELRSSKRHLDKRLREYLLITEGIPECIEQGVSLLKDYVSKTYYPSKDARVAQVAKLNLTELTTDVFLTVSYCIKPEMFTGVVTQLVGLLGFDERSEAITTVAEILAVLSNTPFFDIIKKGKYESLRIQSNLDLPEEVLDAMEAVTTLPPMVCKPLKVETNFCSPYLTYNDCVILGNHNQHARNVCLDVLNIMNSVRLSLNTQFLSTVEEQPTYLLNRDTQPIWARYKRQCYYFYALLAEQNNAFYLTHKVDKRGRIYSQGYQITTQGTSFKKAMIDLADKEVVTGVL